MLTCWCMNAIIVFDTSKHSGNAMLQVSASDCSLDKKGENIFAPNYIVLFRL